MTNPEMLVYEILIVWNREGEMVICNAEDMSPSEAIAEITEAFIQTAHFTIKVPRPEDTGITLEIKPTPPPVVRQD